MPLSFLAGFFGMNFFAPTMPLETWTGLPMYVATLALMVITPVGMYLWMHRRGLV